MRIGYLPASTNRGCESPRCDIVNLRFVPNLTEAANLNRINAAYLERIFGQALHDDERHDAEAHLEQEFVDCIEKIILHKDEITIALKARGNDLAQRLHIAAALKNRAFENRFL